MEDKFECVLLCFIKALFTTGLQPLFQGPELSSVDLTGAQDDTRGLLCTPRVVEPAGLSVSASLAPDSFAWGEQINTFKSSNSSSFCAVTQNFPQLFLSSPLYYSNCAINTLFW